MGRDNKYPSTDENGQLDIEDDAIGIIFLVFYATSPMMLRQFVQKANIKTDYLFLITSYGSDGDQNALRIMKETLENRGITVNYTNSVLMIDNFLPTFDMKSEKTLKKNLNIDGDIEKIRQDLEEKKQQYLDKKHFTDIENIEIILETTMTEKYHIQVGDSCSECKICTKVCPRGNIEIIDAEPQFGDECDFCLGCVHHCKTNTLTINDELNPNERYRNPNIKLSEIIKSNNMTQKKL